VAAPSPIACAQKRALQKAFVKAVSELHRLQSAQVAAVLNGDGFLFRKEIAEAEELRAETKYAILAHQQDHGC
jgi:hypothetical protein